MAILVTLIAFGIGVTLMFVVVRIARHLGKRAEQRRQDEVLQNPDNQVRMLYSAAIDSGAEFRRCLDVVGVNARNRDGNSALHLAYYDAREDAVARLKAFGADQTRVNHDGLTPAEMAAVPEVERLLEQTLACMTACRWLNKEQGRPLYEALKRRPSAIYNAALVRVFQRAGRKAGWCASR